MLKENITIAKSVSAWVIVSIMFTGLFFSIPLSVLAGRVQQYDATNCPNANIGTIAFTVKPLKEKIFRLQE